MKHLCPICKKDMYNFGRFTCSFCDYQCGFNFNNKLIFEHFEFKIGNEHYKIDNYINSNFVKDYCVIEIIKDETFICETVYDFVIPYTENAKEKLLTYLMLS